MERIECQGRTISVREIARPEGWLCRVLVADDGSGYLEYVTSVGPYKTDLPVVHPLTHEDFAAFEAGTLDLGALARNLGERDQARFGR
jgi:hypothetical protein